MVLILYEIQSTSASAHAALPSAALTGAFEAHPPDPSDPRLRLRDLRAAWPFEGDWHLRAQFSPPAEPHVFLDLVDPAAPIPLQPDGTASVRALPLAQLACQPLPPSEEWAWSAEEFAAWAAARRLAAAAAAAAEAAGGGGGGGGGGGEESPGGAASPPHLGSPGSGGSSSGLASGGEASPAWREDGELREGGAAGGGGDALAAAGAAASAAGAAASAALSAAAKGTSELLGAMSAGFSVGFSSVFGKKG